MCFQKKKKPEEIHEICHFCFAYIFMALICIFFLLLTRNVSKLFKQLFIFSFAFRQIFAQKNEEKKQRKVNTKLTKQMSYRHDCAVVFRAMRPQSKNGRNKKKIDTKKLFLVLVNNLKSTLQTLP